MKKMFQLPVWRPAAAAAAAILFLHCSNSTKLRRWREKIRLSDTEYMINQRPLSKQIKQVGRGGGQVVSMLAFFSVNPSSNLAEAYSFFCTICV